MQIKKTKHLKQLKNLRLGGLLGLKERRYLRGVDVIRERNTRRRERRYKAQELRDKEWRERLSNMGERQVRAYYASERPKQDIEIYNAQQSLSFAPSHIGLFS